MMNMTTFGRAGDCALPPLTANASTASPKKVPGTFFPKMVPGNFLREGIGDQFSWRREAADSQHDVLLAVQQVGHRAAGLRAGHVNSTALCARGFVVRAQHRAATSIRHRHGPALARNHERLGREGPDAAGTSAGAASAAGAGDVHALERRMILDGIRRLTVRDLPDDFTLVEINRSDAAPRRFDERQP